MGEQTFTKMSEITIRVTSRSNALVDLNDVNLGPRDIFVGKRAQHLPRSATATDGHDKQSTGGDGATGIASDDLGSTSSNIISSWQSFNLHARFHKHATERGHAFNEIGSERKTHSSSAGGGTRTRTPLSG